MPPPEDIANGLARVRQRVGAADRDRQDQGEADAVRGEQHAEQGRDSRRPAARRRRPRTAITISSGTTYTE